MRHRVACQSLAESLDSYGQNTGAFSTQFTRWGRVEPIGGREYPGGNQDRSETTHRVTIRRDTSTATMTPKWRLLINTVVYDIKALRDLDLEHKFIEIDAAERTDGGS